MASNTSAGVFFHQNRREVRHDPPPIRKYSPNLAVLTSGEELSLALTSRPAVTQDASGGRQSAHAVCASGRCGGRIAGDLEGKCDGSIQCGTRRLVHNEGSCQNATPDRAASPVLDVSRINDLLVAAPIADLSVSCIPVVFHPLPVDYRSRAVDERSGIQIPLQQQGRDPLAAERCGRAEEQRLSAAKCRAIRHGQIARHRSSVDEVGGASSVASVPDAQPEVRVRR